MTGHPVTNYLKSTIVEMNIFLLTKSQSYHIIRALKVIYEHGDNRPQEGVIGVLAIRTFGMRIWLGNASNVLETIVEEVPTKNPEPAMHFVAIQVAVPLSFLLVGMSRLVTFPSDLFLLASISFLLLLFFPLLNSH